MNDQDAIVLAVKILHAATVEKEVDRELLKDLARGAAGIRSINGTLVREAAPSWSDYTRWIVSETRMLAGALDYDLKMARRNKSNAGKHMDSYGRKAPWEVG